MIDGWNYDKDIQSYQRQFPSVNCNLQVKCYAVCQIARSGEEFPFRLDWMVPKITQIYDPVCIQTDIKVKALVWYLHVWLHLIMCFPGYFVFTVKENALQELGVLISTPEANVFGWLGFLKHITSSKYHTLNGPGKLSQYLVILGSFNKKYSMMEVDNYGHWKRYCAN